MATKLLQCINEFIDNISVTDRQEDNIKSSVNNLTSNLKKDDSDLHIKEVFTNGSYERDTILRPLDDVDLFAVLRKEKWADQYGNLPSPQSVLSKIKKYLDGISDYTGKVSQDRPCVSIALSNKRFDILPSFEELYGGYKIPNHDLTSWTFSFPEQLSDQLNQVHRLRSYMVKPTIKAVKSWNREIGKLIPSYHIEEVAINIYNIYGFTNYEESIRLWFNYAESYLTFSKFKSQNDYDVFIKKLQKVKEKLNDARKLYDDSKEEEAIEIWHDVFGKEFPCITEEEAKSMAKAFSNGEGRVGALGMVSLTIGRQVPKSGGYYGEL